MESTIKKLVKELVSKSAIEAGHGRSAHYKCEDALKRSVAYQQIAESADTQWEEMTAKIHAKYTTMADTAKAEMVAEFGKMQNAILTVEEVVNELDSVWNAVADEDFAMLSNLDDYFTNWVRAQWSEQYESLDKLADDRNAIESAIVEYYGAEIRAELYSAENK